MPAGDSVANYYKGDDHMATYEQCRVAHSAYLYALLDPNSTIVTTLSVGTFIDLDEIDSNHFIRTSYNGSIAYIARQNVDTACSDSCAGRNATNMYGTTTLKYEHPAYERAKVYNLQWTLNHLGYNSGTPDGKFGQGTDSAVRSFQGDMGLTVDGKVGSATRAKLIDQLDRG